MGWQGIGPVLWFGVLTWLRVMAAVALGALWTVPVGGGVGKIFHLGRLPINTQLSAYHNMETPQYGPDWQYRVQVQFMFPK